MRRPRAVIESQAPRLQRQTATEAVGRGSRASAVLDEDVRPAEAEGAAGRIEHAVAHDDADVVEARDAVVARLEDARLHAHVVARAHVEAVMPAVKQASMARWRTAVWRASPSRAPKSVTSQTFAASAHRESNPAHMSESPLRTANGFPLSGVRWPDTPSDARISFASFFLAMSRTFIH